MATIFSDNFNRSNSKTLGGSWVEQSPSDYDIVSNQVYGFTYGSGGSGCAFYNSSIGTANYHVYYDFDPSQGGGGEWIEPIARLQSTSSIDDLYMFYFQSISGGSDWGYLIKRVSGTQTNLSSQISLSDYTSTIQIGIKVDGSTISATINGTTVSSVTDTSHTSAGYAGFRINSGAYLDNFNVESLAAASTFKPKILIY